MSQYTTGELAKLCGVTVRTVQYYDTRGILIPTALSEGGRRLYTDDDVRRLKIICFLRDMGLPIDAIAQLLAEEEPGRAVELLLQQQLHHPLKLAAVDLLDGGMDAVHITLHHRGQNIISGHLILRRLNPLYRRQPPADDLLQCLLHGGIAAVSQLGGEPHHRGFADLCRLAQLGGGHEGRLVIVVQNIVGDPLLSLGKAVHTGAYRM